MSKMLTSFDDSTATENVVEVNIVDLVTEAQSRFKNTEIFKFEKIYVDLPSFTMFDDSIIEPMISIDEDNFHRVFSNIISNAMDHGFKNPSTKYRVQTSISLDYDNMAVILEISNNGQPMAEGFSLKHLTTRGEKTTDSKGTGMGGADIKSILNKYSGTLDTIKDESSLFPVTYRIELPLFTITL